ncbi:MAG: gamma-glutamyltransferase [Chloroflexi bacterium]|nr:gamma-glutamyltransferase [Chloroflexota bacterium]MBT4514216.1 gamma-glutamyltransferase [Chloroflexota bacterium]MBT5318544.1 gamma-glutamyltransferase [Chloroflexota bacterium]
MTFFRSRRSSVVARNGAVATSQPLAAQVGLDILKQGGNAVDAAVATAAALNVLEPMSTGVGGDMFALVWKNDEKRVRALNGSGRAAAAANRDDVVRNGHSGIPTEGPDAAFSVSIPGTVHGWETLLEEDGTMTLADVLKPAIKYAHEGYGVSEIIANQWQASEEKLAARPSGQEMLTKGRAPKHGEIVNLPELGRTLETIAEGGSEAFYKGEIAKKLSDFVQSEGGWITEEDMAAHHSDWDVPIHTEYRGVDVWECPPNGDGIAALMALNIAEGFDIAGMGFQSADAYHHLIESMRLGFADALDHVADPRVKEVPIDWMMSKDRAAEQRSRITGGRAMEGVGSGMPYPNSDTVYLTVVDGDGNACSFINSLFKGFGSGMVVPTTGIALQNRGALFSLDSQHANYLEGGARPFQTIIPAMATKDGEMWLSFGVMGGFMQPQGHLQMISNMVDFNLDSQQALDALRFRVFLESGTIGLEAGVDPDTVKDLQRRGHQVKVDDGYDRVGYGGGQIVSRDIETGVLVGGSEPRKDGAAVGY